MIMDIYGNIEASYEKERFLAFVFENTTDNKVCVI